MSIFQYTLSIKTLALTTIIDIHRNNNLYLAILWIFGSILCFVPSAIGQSNVTNANFQAPNGLEVNTWNGNLFYERLDINLPAPGPDIEVVFSYNSRRYLDDLGFGNGWTMSFNMRYSVDGSGNVTIEKSDGGKDVFLWNGATYLAPAGNFETLKQYLPNQFRLTTRDGMRYYFDDSIHARLTRMTDRNNNSIILTYNGSGEVQLIQSSCGSEIALSWTSGHLTTITDSMDVPHRIYNYSYDGSGNLTQYTDPLGNSEQYGYDINNRMSSNSDKNANTLNITYHPSGAVNTLIGPITNQSFSYNPPTFTTTITEVVGGANQTSTFIYDANGRLVQQNGSCCGSSTFYQYDSQNNLSQTTDANGNVTTYGYNAAGQLATETDALGNSKTYTYNLINDQVSDVTDKNGNLTSYKYDANGNLVEINRPEAITEYYSYNPDGTKASYTDGNGNISAYSYDPCGNLINELSALSYTRSYVYNLRGELLSSTNTNGCISTYSYDPLGRLLSESDALGNVSNYSYDPVGNRIGETDGLGRTITYSYDPLNRLIVQSEPLGVTTHTIYNEKNPIQKVDPLGLISNYSYDPLNRLIQETDPLGNNVNYSYDPVGNLISITDPLGNTSLYTYDPLNQLLTNTDALGGVISYVYDGNGNRVAQIDELANQISYNYDGMNRLVSLTDPLGGVTTYTYDFNGNQIQVTDASGNTSTNNYDAENRLINFVNALGSVTVYAYDGEDKTISVTDANGNTASNTFDCLNRIITSTNALGETTSFIYDAVGNEVQRNVYSGNQIVFTYDDRNRITDIVDLLGLSSQYTYDLNDNTSSYTDGNLNTTTYTYDPLNRLVQEIDPLGEQRVYAYDANSNIIADTDRNGNNTTYEYDALNRQTKVTDALAGEILHSYDLAGNLLQITDEQTNTTTYTYDPLNRLIIETYDDASQTQYTYDAVGNRTQRIDNNGNITNYTYDPLNRLIQRDYPDTNDDNFSYDPGSRLTNASNNNATINFTYDAVDRLLSETLNGNTTSYSYDPALNRISISYPNGRSLERHYDWRDRLDSIKEGSTLIVDFTYDQGNRLLQKSYVNGVQQSNSYNSNNWITQLIHNNGVNFIDYTYDHDKEGNRVYSNYNHKTDFSEEYQYDNLYRLSNYKKGTLVGMSIPAPTTQSIYTYDAIGNRTNLNMDGNNTVYTSNNMNEYTQIANPAIVNPQYDDNGNLKQDENFDYIYDFENRLLEAGDDITYSYDPLGRRIRKIAEGFITNYFYDRSSVVQEVLENPNCPYFINLTGEDQSLIRTYEAQDFIRSTVNIKGNSQIIYSASDSIVLDTGFSVEQGSEFEANSIGCVVANDTAVITTYVYGTGKDDVLSMRKSTNNYYYHQNALGSINALTDEGGSVVERYEYDPYGGPVFYDGNYNAGAQSSVDNPYLFTGRRYDRESGFYYYRARYYDPINGRFIQRDPLGYIDGLNLYEYVGGNVINWTDPDGTKIWIKGNDGKKYEYRGGKIYDEKGKEVKCPKDEFVKRVKKDLDQLKKDDPDMKKKIEDLEKSKKDHNIEKTAGGNTNTPESGADDRAGKSTGSTTKYNPDAKHNTSDREKQKNDPTAKRDPRVGLAHELTHAHDSDQGTTNWTPTDNGIPGYEVDAVNQENKIRAKTGDKKRTTYGGKKIPKKLLK